MNKLIIIFLLTLLLSHFANGNDVFVGKIVYKNTFTDLKGNDVTDKLTPYFGREQHYFIDGKNYKSYNENMNWVQLYHSETNTYYSFEKNKTGVKFDASKQSSKKYVAKRLDKKERILGYDCKAIEVKTDDSTTIYYYTSAIKTNTTVFSKHNFGDWNKYLASTQGALSLKFVTTDRKNGFIWTSVATEVSRQTLSAKDFEVPKDVKF